MERMSNAKVVQIASMGVASAAVALGTLFLKIPGVTGYYHLGDGLIFTASLVFGPAVGAVAGGFGSAVADILGGWAVWAPWTLIIKSMAGWVVGVLGHNKGVAGRLLGMTAGALVVVLGYAAATWILYGPAAVALEIYGNIGQSASGIVIGAVGSAALIKARMTK